MRQMMGWKVSQPLEGYVLFRNKEKLSMIIPTVGRIMWLKRPGIDIEAAIVTGVLGEGEAVNVCAFAFTGQSSPLQNVPVVQEGAPKPLSHYVSWMPYQQAQAKKDAVQGFQPPAKQPIMDKPEA